MPYMSPLSIIFINFRLIINRERKSVVWGGLQGGESLNPELKSMECTMLLWGQNAEKALFGIDMTL